MRLPNFNARVMNKASIIFCVLQALWIPVLIGLVGAAMAQPQKAMGASRYMFALCWFFIPGLIFVSMSPRFERTRPLANPYAILGVNVIYCFLFFVAFIAVAAQNGSQKDKSFNSLPEDARKDKKASCSTVADDYKKECSLNNTSVALGVFMFLWLLANTLIATYIALYYRVHLITPLEADATDANNIQEHTKDAFGDAAAEEPDGYALVEGNDGFGGQGSLGYSGSRAGAGRSNYDDEEEFYDGPYTRRNVGSGSYEVGSQGVPPGDYSYTGSSGRV